MLVQAHAQGAEVLQRNKARGDHGSALSGLKLTKTKRTLARPRWVSTRKKGIPWGYGRGAGWSAASTTRRLQTWPRQLR